MKRSLLLLNLSFLLLFLACSEEDPAWRLSRVEVKNVNNEGEYPVVSVDSIRKEAYALDILYVGERVSDGSDYSRVDFKNCKDAVVSQRFFCDKDIDAAYPAGSDITRLFKPIYGNTIDVGNLNTKWHGGTYVLTRVPAAPGVYSFRVSLYLENGDVIEESAIPVKLY